MQETAVHQCIRVIMQTDSIFLKLLQSSDVCRRGNRSSDRLFDESHDAPAESSSEKIEQEDAET